MTRAGTAQVPLLEPGKLEHGSNETAHGVCHENNYITLELQPTPSSNKYFFTRCDYTE